jgi:hypothetical protein
MLAAVVGACAVASLASAAPALAGAGSIDTTNAGCSQVNGNNLYLTKQDVYLRGKGWDAGAQFYVMVSNPSTAEVYGVNDDTVTNTTDGSGNLPCTHLWDVVRRFSDNLQQGYDDTTNNGHEYKVSVSTDPTFRDPTKTDNFKVVATECAVDCGFPSADLTVTNTVLTTTLTRTTTWGLNKSVTGGSERDVPAGTDATFNYQVDVTHMTKDSAWTVTGQLTINNADVGTATNVTVSDAIDDPNATCAVDTTGFSGTIGGAGTQTFPYTCTYSAAPASPAQTNTAGVGWTNADLTMGSASGQAPVDWTTATVTDVDPSVSVSDPYMVPTPQTVTASDPSPTTITYSHTFSGDTAGTCTSHDNTASFTTGGSTPDQTGSDTETVKVCVGANLSVSKTAATTFTRSYHWSIKKTADVALIEKAGGGTATAAFHVKVDQTDLVDSAWKVSGTITVSNPNDWESITADVTDAIQGGGVCTVTGSPVTLAAGGSANLAYSCTYAVAPTAASGTNTAAATWDATAAHTPDGSKSGTAPYTFGSPTTRVNQTINVTDAFNGGAATALGTTLTASDDAAHLTSANLPFTKSVTVPATNCVTYSNTATITETSQSSTATVEVCGPAKTGALTIGYWQNKNGQAIITGGASVSGVCKSGTWLRGYLPFQDLSATATCAQVATYATNIIKAANASGAAMNAMLKAQMLATALDVYFSDPALGGNKITAPAPIGGVKVDLTMICKMIDGSSGAATCGGAYQNTVAAFGGSPTLQTVSQLLAYAASQSNAGGTAWYGQVKAMQGLAKDTFDAINNEVVFSP